MDIDSIARAIRLDLGYLRTIAQATPSPSPIHGTGLFANADLAPGTVLTKLDGQRVTTSEAPGVLFALEWNAVSKSELLVRAIRTSYGFINHSRTPNLRIDGGTMTLKVLTPVASGEELLLDYLEQPLPDAYLSNANADYLRR